MVELKEELTDLLVIYVSLSTSKEKMLHTVSILMPVPR